MSWYWCLARAWEDRFSHWAFEGITRMLQGLAAPGLSDFTLPLAPAPAPRARPRPPGLPARPAPRPFGPLRPGPRTPEVGVGSRGARPAVRRRPGAASRVTQSGLQRSAPPRARSGLTCPAR
ncbi:translation initiation factor IF-2-like [Cricetulus griseus]|uniref:Translation initiation factor IF-2-like n=1 Tax=Cricetulus griseus TaxID=10029 RepID=A0A9J7GMF8_CRIGR|nr:translation initiation factor IF-2-like [Cricetulus griseus]